MIPKCPICGEPLFDGPWRDVRIDKVYCSPACKQKAYRQRQGADPGTARQRAADTKAGETCMITCEWCRESHEVPLSAAKRRYCSNACKQAAYRARKHDT